MTKLSENLLRFLNMPRNLPFGIITIVFFLNMFVNAACSDLNVFLPENNSSNKKIQEVTLSPDGYFEVKFKNGVIKKGENYTLHVQKVSEISASLSLTDEEFDSEGAVSTIQAEIDSTESPEAAAQASMPFKAGEPVILKEAIDSESYYIFEAKKVVNQKSRPHKIDVTIAKAKMRPPVVVPPKSFDTKVRVQWAAVDLALSYNIYADATGAKLLGTTTDNFFDFDTKANVVPSQVWIQSTRGTLIAKEMIKASLVASKVKVVAIHEPQSVYRQGDTVDFTIEYSDKVVVPDNSTITIDDSGRKAVFKSGNDSNVLTYSYKISNDEESFALNVAAPNGLKDEAGSFLVSLASDNKVGILTIDTIKPTAPLSPGFSATLSSNGTASVSFGLSTDEFLQTHNVKLCLASDCQTSCTAPKTSDLSPASFTGLVDGVYYACVQGEDSVGQTSAWVSSFLTLDVSGGPPVVTSVTSSKANGTYTVGEIITINVQFSRVVSVTHSSDLGLLLETGTPDRTAIYSGGSASTTLNFQYTVQSGDSSGDLEYESTAALSLGALGTIRDVIGNDALITLPALGSLQSLAGAKAIAIQTAAPTGASISIAAAASYTNVASNTLTLAATGANEMYITNSAGCASGGAWESFATSKAWSLGQSNATATVYAKFRDAVGNETSCVNDTIIHDALAPTGNSISIAAAATHTTVVSNTLTLGSTGASEMYITNTAGCSAGGAWEAYATSKTWSLGQTEATATVYTKFRDLAGNETACVNDTIIHDATAPTVPTISIAAAAGYTNVVSNTLTLSATAATEMYITNTAACASGGTWETYATSKAWSLGQTNATATVYVKYRDAAGNESTCENDTIIHDALVPTANSISIAAAATYTTVVSNTLTLASTGASEMYITNTAGCATGGTWETYATSQTWSLGQTDATATVYTKFRDQAGNESACVNDTIIHDGTAPTVPTISIAAAATYTNVVSNTLTLSASAATEMYITNTTACASGGSWETYATSKAWSLGQTDATATVYVKYRDAAGNESTCASDTIIHDAIAPTVTSISIAAGATYTAVTSNTLTLAATGASEMYISNTAGCASGGSWETYATSKAWSLGQTNATATAYIKYIDLAGNESACINDTIVHDTTTPTSPSISIDSAAYTTATTAVTLTLSSTDANAQEMYITNTAGCGSGGTWETYATSKAWTLGQTNATTAVYVKFRDGALNTGSCVNDTIIHSDQAPTATSISINAAAATAGHAASTLTLGATEAIEMYITNVAGCGEGGAWITYATSKAWTLSPSLALGAQVYAKFRSASLLESACISDTITLAPVDIAVNGNFESGDLTGWTNTIGGNWVVDNTSPIAGTYSAHTSGVADGTEACLTQTIDLTSSATDYMVTFNWSYGMEQSYDSARFYVDVTLKASAVGSGSGAVSVNVIKGGPHTLKWCYYKDGDLSANGDFVRIDDIKIKPTLLYPPATIRVVGENLGALIFATHSTHPATGVLWVANTGAVTFTPVNGTSYATGNTFGSNKVVYSGTILGVAISGLTAATNYNYRLYVYNAANEYSLPLTANATTDALHVPYLFSGTSGVDQNHLSWTTYGGGIQSGYIVVRHAGTPVTFTPVQGTPYAVGAVGSDTLVYKGSASTFTDTGLSAGTQYYYTTWAYGAGDTYSLQSILTSVTARSCTGLVRSASCWFMGVRKQSCNNVCNLNSLTWHSGKLDELFAADPDRAAVCTGIFNDLGVFSGNPGLIVYYGPTASFCSQLTQSTNGFMISQDNPSSGTETKSDAAFACPCH